MPWVRVGLWPYTVAVHKCWVQLLGVKDECQETGLALGIRTYSAPKDTNTAEILHEMNINGEKKEETLARRAGLETLLWLLGFN